MFTVRSCRIPGAKEVLFTNPLFTYYFSSGKVGKLCGWMYESFPLVLGDNVKWEIFSGQNFHRFRSWPNIRENFIRELGVLVVLSLDCDQHL